MSCVHDQHIPRSASRGSFLYSDFICDWSYNNSTCTCIWSKQVLSLDQVWFGAADKNDTLCPCLSKGDGCCPPDSTSLLLVRTKLLVKGMIQRSKAIIRNPGQLTAPVMTTVFPVWRSSWLKGSIAGYVSLCHVGVNEGYGGCCIAKVPRC